MRERPSPRQRALFSFVTIRNGKLPVIGRNDAGLADFLGPPANMRYAILLRADGEPASVAGVRCLCAHARAAPVGLAGTALDRAVPTRSNCDCCGDAACHKWPSIALGSSTQLRKALSRPATY